MLCSLVLAPLVRPLADLHALADERIVHDAPRAPRHSAAEATWRGRLAEGSPHGLSAGRAQDVGLAGAAEHGSTTEVLRRGERHGRAGDRAHRHAANHLRGAERGGGERRRRSASVCAVVIFNAQHSQGARDLKKILAYPAAAAASPRALNGARAHAQHSPVLHHLPAQRSDEISKRHVITTASCFPARCEPSHKAEKISARGPVL